MDQCILIATGAFIPDGVGSVVKYEIVNAATGDGHAGSAVSLVAPAKQGLSVCTVGKEAKSTKWPSSAARSSTLSVLGYWRGGGGRSECVRYRVDGRPSFGAAFVVRACRVGVGLSIAIA